MPPGSYGAQGQSGSYRPYAAGLPFPSIHQRFAAEQKTVPWGKRALVAYLVVAVVGSTILWVDRSTSRVTLHSFRVLIHTGVLLRPSVRPITHTLILDLTGLVGIGVYVAFLIWQFHAAKTSQLMGYPAKHSPGLGVGSWFIPVVDWWFPYQAIRDCLPPGDPGRRVVLRMWLCWVGALATGPANYVLLYTSGTAYALGLAVDFGLRAGFVFFGLAAIRLIADAHQRLVVPTQAADPYGSTGTWPTA